MRVAETDIEFVVAVNNPVKSSQETVVGGVDDVVLVLAGVVIVFVFQVLPDTVHAADRWTAIAVAAPRGLLVSAGLCCGSGYAFGSVFRIKEKEQFVFDYRTFKVEFIAHDPYADTSVCLFEITVVCPDVNNAAHPATVAGGKRSFVECHLFYCLRLENRE